LELELSGWIIVALSAMMIGISKTGIPGVAILVVPMMAIAIPARQSVGVLLGILILADIFAVTYHRHNARWSHVLKLLPPTLLGIAAGYYLLRLIDDDNKLKPIIGGIGIGKLDPAGFIGPHMKIGGENRISDITPDLSN